MIVKPEDRETVRVARDMMIAMDRLIRNPDFAVLMEHLRKRSAALAEVALGESNTGKDRNKARLQRLGIEEAMKTAHTLRSGSESTLRGHGWNPGEDSPEEDNPPEA